MMRHQQQVRGFGKRRLDQVGLKQGEVDEVCCTWKSSRKSACRSAGGLGAQWERDSLPSPSTRHLGEITPNAPHREE
jgi:hypothetical protein